MSILSIILSPGSGCHTEAVENESQSGGWDAGRRDRLDPPAGIACGVGRGRSATAWGSEDGGIGSADGAGWPQTPAAAVEEPTDIIERQPRRIVRPEIAGGTTMVRGRRRVGRRTVALLDLLVVYSRLDVVTVVLL